MTLIINLIYNNSGDDMNKGFTLIELIGIVALLGIIFLVAYTEVNKSIDKSNNELYQAQLSNIKASAHDWAVDNIDRLPENGEVTKVTLSELINGGYIESDDSGNIENPKTKKPLSKDIYVKITKRANNYVYEVID